MTEPGYFETLYAENDDPWGLASRPYERRKYEITLACLPRRRYRSAFEPGCSIGVLSAQLGRRCDRVLAMDGAARAIEQAKDRIHAPNITIVTGKVPDDWPDDTFDLIILSELMYFLSARDRSGVIERATASLADDGHLITVNWRHAFAEAACDGQTVCNELIEQLPFPLLVDHTEDDFLLQVFGHGEIC